jgi:hypothetical protein
MSGEMSGEQRSRQGNEHGGILVDMVDTMDAMAGKGFQSQ